MAIVRALALQVSRDELPGVPSAHVLRLSRDGQLLVEGPVAADDRSVARAAHLLETVLPPFDAPPELRAPGALRLVIARALGTLDLPPYPSVQSFADALARFAHPDPLTVVRELFASWAAAVEVSEASPIVAPAAPPAHDVALVPMPAVVNEEPAPAMPANSGLLTVSDIRRARRATGLTLGEVSKRSRIPVWLLRELEWGYLRNWPGGLYGRTQLLRYARAAGLDGEVVTRTLWPMVEEDARADEERAIVRTELPEETAALALIPRPVPAVAAADRRPSRWLVALAIPALIAVGVAPALWDRAVHRDVALVASTRVARTESPARDAAPAAPTGATPQKKSEPVKAPVAAAPAVERPHQQSGIPDRPAYSPSFSSVGSAMFYHAESDGRATLMRADTDSRGAVLRITSVVDDRARNFHARPSPDGSRIAFDSDREGERAVFVADSDGHNVRRISGDGFAAIPSWSPDGRALAYVRAEPERPRVWNIWISDLETGRTRRVTSHAYGQPWGASWFPDGRRIAYSHETRLIIRDLATGRERVFNSPVKGKLVRTPAVSPDGRRVIFQVLKDGAWLLDVPDGSMRKVLSDGSAEEYTWAPDGRRVAYHSRRSGDWGVWVMAAR